MITKIGLLLKEAVHVGFLHGKFRNVDIRVQDGAEGKHKLPHVHITDGTNGSYVYFWNKESGLGVDDPECWDDGRMPSKALRCEIGKFCAANKEVLMDLHTQFTNGCVTAGNRNLTY